MNNPASTVASRLMSAPPEAVYRAFLDAHSVTAWLPPGAMQGVVHSFDGREGGSFRISLVYPEGEKSLRGKTSERTDTIRGRFAKLISNELVVWATEFESADPAFAGEMIVSWTLAPAGTGTKVTVLCENLPRGVRPEDNQAGSRSTLEKLASFVERQPPSADA